MGREANVVRERRCRACFPAHGLTAPAHELKIHALGVVPAANVDLDAPLTPAPRRALPLFALVLGALGGLEMPWGKRRNLKARAPKTKAQRSGASA